MFSVISALTASAIMAAAVLLARGVMPAGWPLPVRLACLIAVGAFSHAGAVFAFHRERLNNLVRAILNIRNEQPSKQEAATASTHLG